MMKDDKNTEESSAAASLALALRARAEELLGKNLARLAAEPKDLSPEAMQSLVHDLRVHQVELEMQNDELRRMQLELNLSRERYFDLYDLAPMGYCTLTASGLIAEANLTMATLLGFSRAALVNKPVSRFIVKDDQDIYYLHHHRLMKTGELQTCELHMVGSNGLPFWAHLTTTVAQNADGQPWSRIVISDISQRKLDEANLREAQIQAETANHAKNKFLSRMSHELRTPLNAILGFAQLMKNSDENKKISDYRSRIDIIIRSGWLLTRIIEDILNLSAIEAHAVLLQNENIDIGTCLGKCLEMIAPLACDRKLELTCDNSAWQEGVMIQADAFRLEQVLINLLTNAVKYNHDGGSISVSGIRIAGRLRLLITDTGEGIHDEEKELLFQPFSRLAERACHIEGAGIGLAVAKQLTELMSGSIGVESVYGKGSTFWIEFPVISA